MKKNAVVTPPRTRNGLLLAACLLLCGFSLAAPGEGEQAAGSDPRQSLGLSAAERTEFLAEMRQMLASVQGVVAGIAARDRTSIAEAARASGNRLARATPQSIRERLPREFKEIGGPMHLMFEELAIRAETDDMETLTAFTGELMQQCLACHSMFRAD
jgi:cytochrome c556